MVRRINSSSHLLTLEIGRLLYTTGDAEGAVKLLLGILKGTSSSVPSLSLPGPIMGPSGTVGAPPTQEAQVNLDKTFLDDFRVAFGVSPLHAIPGTTLICLDDLRSIGRKPWAGNLIWRLSAFPSRFVNQI